MLAALPQATALAAGAPEPPAGGPASMRICISRWAAATRHPSREQISRNRETTKTRKPETKCRRPPEPESSLMHLLHNSIRRGRGHGRSGTVPEPRSAQRSVRPPRWPGKRAGPTQGLSASVSDKALAFLELAELPVRETRRAPILHVSQRGVARCRGAHRGRQRGRRHGKPLRIGRFHPADRHLPTRR